jgi:hypothetical protein
MEHIEWIVKVVVGAAAVFTAILTIARPVRKLASRFERMERHVTENYKTCLKLSVWTRELPLSERVNAGEAAIKMDVNGATAARHKINLHELEKEMNGDG